MIKRRFYKQGHGSESSDSSSSSSNSGSDSDSIPEVQEDEVEQAEEEEEEEEEGGGGGGGGGGGDDEEVERAKSEIDEKKKKGNKRNRHSPSPGSGYESEDSSANDVKVNSSGLLTSEEDSIETGGRNLKDRQFSNKAITKETDEGDSNAVGRTLNESDHIRAEFAECILKCKSVFKCRLCPRIVCLSEDTVKAHLNSKRHARSKKLLGEGRLKLMLNSDGEIEEDMETHEERHHRTVAVAKEPVAPEKKDSGRKRQSLRRKKKLHNSSNKGKSAEVSKSPQRKRRKNEI